MKNILKRCLSPLLGILMVVGTVSATTFAAEARIHPNVTTTTVDASCTSRGETAKTCTDCGESNATGSLHINAPKKGVSNDETYD